MSNDNATHPFVLDLLAGWQDFVDDHAGDHQRHDSEYVSAICALYQKAGNELTGDDEGAGSATPEEQLAWLVRELQSLLPRLAALDRPLHTPAPVEDQDDDTDFGEEKECEVELTDWVRLDATVTVTARSKQEAAEKARELAEEDEVDWKNSWESQGETEVDSVVVVE